MALTLRQEIVEWTEAQGGIAWRVTGGIVGAFFTYGCQEEVRSIVHFVVSIGHTNWFTDARVTKLRAYGFMAGIATNFEEFKGLVDGFNETGCKERRERGCNNFSPSSGGSASI